MPKAGLQPGDKLPNKRSRLKSYPKLPKPQQKLVEEHLWVAGRLAYSARSLTGGFTGCYTKEDLESVALFALCVAATRYKPELGWKFSTYAWTTCRGWIQHALRDYSRMVRIPRWLGGIRKEVRELAKKDTHTTKLRKNSVWMSMKLPCAKSHGRKFMLHTTILPMTLVRKSSRTKLMKSKS